MSKPTLATAALPRRGRLRPHAALSTRNKVGLVLTFLIGLFSVPSIVGAGEEPKEGYDSPPVAVLILGSVFGVIMVVACWLAWRSAGRDAIRVAAGSSIVQAISTVPAFFVDIESTLKVVSAVSFLVGVVGIVLILSPERRNPAVVD